MLFSKINGIKILQSGNSNEQFVGGQRSSKIRYNCKIDSKSVDESNVKPVHE